MLLAAVVIVVFSVKASRIYKAVHAPLTTDQTVFFSIESGTSLRSAAAELEERDLIDSADHLIWLARVKGNKPIQATDYEFPVGTTLVQAYEAMISGSMRSPERQVTVIEGLTLEQTADVLAEAGLVESADAFITAASTALDRFTPRFEFLSSRPENASLEGYLFPDTYRFLAETTPDEIINKMLSNFNAKLTDDMRRKILDSGRTIHEAVTLASIVEREVRTPDEMRVVAGLFINRLDINMALQADSTVGYLTKSGRDRSTFADLEIDSPYNTYKYAGLPPGPISNPGFNALNAVANPTDTNYLYFLTDKNGKVYYAADHDGHIRNRNLYLD
jgi:UPF0755 protein